MWKDDKTDEHTLKDCGVLRTIWKAIRTVTPVCRASFYPHAMFCLECGVQLKIVHGHNEYEGILVVLLHMLLVQFEDVLI